MYDRIDLRPFLAIALCGTMLFSMQSVEAQSVNKLKEQVRSVEADIARINNLLDGNKKEQKNSLQNLQMVDKKIEGRKKIVESIDRQIETVTGEMGSRGKEVNLHTRTIQQLKSRYANLIRASYLSSKQHNFMAFILSAEDFNDAVRRIYYVRHYSEHIKEKSHEIDSLNRQLRGEISSLKEQQAELSGLMKDKAEEVKLLDKEKQEFSRLTASLKGEESKLRSEATRRRSQIDQLQRQIEKIIAEEARASGREPATKASVALSGEFAQNKGKLPSPVSGGVVVDRFGIHNHPTQKGVKVDNKGINIACREGSSVKSVFGGEVRRVFFVPGLGSSVIVRHGNFLTVYSNLKSVAVKQGDKLGHGQQIGTIGESADGQPTLHFEVWRESENLNPEQWIVI